MTCCVYISQISEMDQQSPNPYISIIRFSVEVAGKKGNLETQRSMQPGYKAIKL